MEAEAVRVPGVTDIGGQGSVEAPFPLKGGDLLAHLGWWRYPLPVNFLVSEPANLRLNSSSVIVGGENSGNGTANGPSTTINSGA